MTQKFSKKTCLIYVAVLISIFSLGTIYSDNLYQQSHQVIKDLQAGHAMDGHYVSFMTWLSEFTHDDLYLLVILFMSPFLSRQRFWYYIVAV